MNARLTALLLAGVIAGCSGIRTYPSGPDKNLIIRTQLKSGSVLSTVSAALHIHRADANCGAQYEGTVQLSEPLTRIAIPPERPSYLVFSFGSSALLGTSSSSMRYETLLRPRAGHSYEIKVSHIDDFYAVTIREIDPRRPSGRDIARATLKACS